MSTFRLIQIHSRIINENGPNPLILITMKLQTFSTLMLIYHILQNYSIIVFATTTSFASVYSLNLHVLLSMHLLACTVVVQQVTS